MIILIQLYHFFNVRPKFNRPTIKSNYFIRSFVKNNNFDKEIRNLINFKKSLFSSNLQTKKNDCQILLSHY